MTAKTKSHTAVAPLLYWLLAVSGLVGLTFVRADALDDVAPVWLGTVAGIAGGQLLARLRVRPWLPIVFFIASFWFWGIAYFVFWNEFREAFYLTVATAIPAAVCGYASLSERGGLLSFWYPAMLWMLVILDGPGATLDSRASLPFVVALGILFVAFLRARETRRVALWRAHAHERLAATPQRSVLRASPFRAAFDRGWTVLVGVGALVVTAWVAPHPWQKERAAHARALEAQNTPAAFTSEIPCCDPNEPGEGSRVKEYLPLTGASREPEHKLCYGTCAVPPAHVEKGPVFHGRLCHLASDDPTSDCVWFDGETRLADDDAVSYTPPGFAYGPGGYVAAGGGAYTYTPGAMPVTPSEPPLPSTPGAAPATLDPMPAQPTITPVTPTTPLAPAAPTVDPAPQAPVATPQVAPPPALPGQSHATPSSTTKRAPIVVAAPVETGVPWWASILYTCVAALALNGVWRAVRRELTLSHLTRPFWREDLDQRISNHWQRMLVGLRDAGIQPTPDEQPGAFARRVGIEGMETCATILERVRHGVRVDDGDVDAMNASASSVYRAARARAGLLAQAVAWLRWPLT